MEKAALRDIEAIDTSSVCASAMLIRFENSAARMNNNHGSHNRVREPTLNSKLECDTSTKRATTRWADWDSEGRQYGLHDGRRGFRGSCGLRCERDAFGLIGG